MAFVRRMLLKTDFDPEEVDQLGMVTEEFDPPENAKLVGIDWQPGRVALFWLVHTD